MNLNNFASFLTKLDTENLALIRFQNHLPYGDSLKSLFIREGFARKTIHFSLSCIPPDVNRRNFHYSWQTHNVLIICPWKSFIVANGKPTGGNITDLFWLHEVELPINAIIIFRGSTFLNYENKDRLKHFNVISTKSGNKHPFSLTAYLHDGGFYNFDSTFMSLAKIIGKEQELARHQDFIAFKKFASIEGFVTSAHPLTHARLFEGLCVLLKTLVERYGNWWFIKDIDFRQIALRNLKEMLLSDEPVKIAAGSIATLWGDVIPSMKSLVSQCSPSVVLNWMERHICITRVVGIRKEQAPSDQDVLVELDFWFPHSFEQVRHLQRLLEAYSP